MSKGLIVALALLAACFLSSGAIADETKVVSLGITNHAVTEAELAKGGELPAPHFNTAAVAFALVANVKQGDVVELALKNGDSALLHNTQEPTADQPSLLLMAGKTGVPAGGWPAGEYRAELKITRDGKALLEQSTKPAAFD